MHIGIDASSWINRRGYGRFTRELLHAMSACAAGHIYWLFMDSRTAALADGSDTPMPRAVERVVVPTSAAAAEAASATGRRSIRDMWAMGAAVRRHRPRLDLFYFPTVYTYFPVRISAPILVTIHDTTPERFPQFVFAGRMPRLMWQLKVQLAVRQAASIITVSETSRAAIAAQFHVGAERVRVVPDAPDPIFRPVEDAAQNRAVAARYGIAPAARYILYVGGISPHKNLATLLAAYRLLLTTHARGADAPALVLVGDYERDVFLSSYDALRIQLTDPALAGRVLFTGFVPDADLVHLYNGAEMLVMPSLDEGFGLPAVEAMACGAPVVASRAGSLPEVIGDAGLFFDPCSPEELCDCLSAVLDDGARRLALAAAGPGRAGEFSWPRSAAAALSVFEEMATK
jgi:glycosyltransferase involved in cell wall biosynthesis